MNPGRFRAYLYVAVCLATLSILAPPVDAVRISEIMYHPAGSVANGDPDLEFIEIVNEESTPVDLLEYEFCGGVRYVFAERVFIDPGEYLVIAADPEAVKQVYGIEKVVGPWDPETSLDNGGERIRLCDNAGVTRATVNYNDRGKWPGGADGTGHSLEIENVYGEQEDPDNWNLSGRIGGSPGAANDTETGKVPVVLNELYSIVPDGGERWVELYNKGDAEVDLSGYHLSDDRGDLTKTTLAADLRIAAGGYVVLTDTALGLDFSVEEPRDKVFLILTNPAGDRVVDARTFRPAQLGSSEARIPSGSKSYSEIAVPTRGSANRVDVVRDIVINEIHYHPIDEDDDKEFVELYNRGDAAVDLSGWAFSDGINFVFPDVTLAPDSYLVVARNPELLRELYGLPQGAVIGPATDEALEDFARLSNSGERLTLVDPAGNIADTVSYRDGGEWSLWTDGGGSTLELIDPWQHNDNPQAWDASDDSARAPLTEVSYKGLYNGQPESELHLGLSGRGIAIVDDIAMTTRTTTVQLETTFVPFDSTWRYFGSTEPPPANWAEPGFDDSGWLSGQAIIGYGEEDETTVIEDMRRNYLALFLRTTFEVPDLGLLDDPEGLKRLILSLEYDDGYVAYLNGTRILVTNMRDPEHPTYFDTRAQTGRDKQRDDNDITDEWKSLLKQGTNVLAVSVHNSTASSNDLRFQAQLATGYFVNEDGPNLLTDGSFEAEDTIADNWRIQGTHDQSGFYGADPITGAGSLKIVSTGNVDNKVNRIETTNPGLAARLTRGADYLVSYKARWVVGTATLLTRGQDQGSTTPSYAHSEQLRLPDFFGTPGSMNTATRRQIERTGESNLGPVVEKVSHTPAVPEPDQPVTVTARVLDSDGLADVTLHYSIDTPAPENDAAEHNTIPMADPDEDGVYVAEIPGQARNKIVVFYITATDTRGQAGRFPIDYLSRTHPSVRDTAAATLDDPRYALYRHDSAYTGPYQSYRAVVHLGNERYMDRRALHSNALVDSTFIFNDRDIYYNAGVRFSGSPFVRQKWSLSWRVRMPRDNPLHAEYEKFGLEEHQGAGGRDGRETLSHYMLRFNQGHTTRVPYSTEWPVQWQVNRRVNGVRGHYYMPGRQFLELWFPDDQNGLFFEMDDRHTINDGGTRSDSTNGRVFYPPYPGPEGSGADKESYRYYFMPRGGNPFDDWSHFIEFCRVMTPAEVEDEEFDERIWEVADVEEILRILSIRVNTDDWDTWGGRRGKNCYWYRPEQQGKWVLLAWDMELTYADSGSFAPPRLTATSDPQYRMDQFAELTRMINRPRIKRMFYGIMHEMMNHQFNSGFLAPYMTKLREAGVQATQHGMPNQFVDRRNAFLRTRVNGVTAEAVDFAITTNEGNPIESDTPVVVIEGTAPVEVFSISVVIDGDTESAFSADFSSESLLGWSAAIQLTEGRHTIEFVAFDAHQKPLAMVGTEVTIGASAEKFVRGDVDLTGGVSVTDAINTLLHLFASHEIKCQDAADSNDDGEVNLTDAVFTLGYLFEAGAPPPGPFPVAGTDGTADTLGCEEGLRL